MTSWKLLLILLAIFSLPVQALETLGGPEEELLDPDQAFAFSVTVKDDSTLQASWTIADGYYMYRERIRFQTDTPGFELGEPGLPAGKIKNDEFFGEIAVFRDRVTATIPFERTEDGLDNLRLIAVSQGCADIGVCYPPQKKQLKLKK